MTNLSKIIKKRREALEISQGKLGRALGFQNGQFISNIELNDIQYPAIYFKKLSKILHLDMRTLYEAAVDDYALWLDREIKRGK